MIYADWLRSSRPCRKCGKENVLYRVVESYDGAHEDEQFRCPDCNGEWWIDGSDS